MASAFDVAHYILSKNGQMSAMKLLTPTEN